MVATLVLSRMAEAYADPRKSARRIINAAPTPGEVLTMVFAGVTIGIAAELAAALMMGVGAEPVPSPDTADPGAVEAPAGPTRLSTGTFVGFNFAIGLAQFFLVTWLATVIGNKAGGAGARGEIAAVVGWHALAQAPFAVLGAALSIAAGGSDALAFVFLIKIGLTFYLFYMMAAFIAEAHRFNSTAKVLTAMIGLVFGFALVLTFVFQALGIRVAG